MIHLGDILDLATLERLVADRYVARVASADGRFALYNYTDRATYERLTIPEVLQCRGLVVDDRGRVRARPFARFFNWGELDEATRAALAAAPLADVTEKLDGSLGVVWHDGDGWRCTTRGAFDSPQAAWATNQLRLGRYALGDRFADCTLLVEIIHPANRIVLDYGAMAELVLLGARYTYTGWDFTRDAIQALGREIAMPVVGGTLRPSPAPDARDLIAELLRSCETERGREGWVARWDDGTRVKFKTADYIALHKLATGFSAERVREAMLAGTLDAYVAAMPEEFGDEAERIRAAIDRRLAADLAVVAEAEDRLRHLDTGGRDGRKRFADAVVATVDARLRGYVFRLHDHKPVAPELLRKLDLSDLAGARSLISWREAAGESPEEGGRA